MKGTEGLKRGDVLLIYRTKDDKGPAKFRSVTTSVCVVEEVKRPSDFETEDEFIKYTNAYSIFEEQGLKEWYQRSKAVVIKMTYNAAFYRKVTNGKMTAMGINAQYWGFFELIDEQFDKILKEGEINESLIIN